MRILIINNISFKYKQSMISGGIEKSIFDQAKVLKDYGETPIFLMTKDSDDVQEYNFLKSEIISKEEWTKVMGKKQQFVGKKLYESLIKYKDEFDAIILNSDLTSMVVGVKMFLNEHPVPTLAIIHNTASYGMLSLTFNQELKKLIDTTCAITASVSKFAFNDNNNMIKDCINDICVLQYTEMKDEVEESKDYNMIFQRTDSSKNLPTALTAAGKSGIKTYFFTNKRKCTDADDELEGILDNIINKYPNIEAKYNRPHSEIMDYLKNARCQIFTGLIDSASITTFESAVRGVPTVIQYKNKCEDLESRLAPYMFLSVSEYFNDVCTYRKNFDKATDMLAEKIKEVDTSFELRKNSAKRIREYFTKDKVYNNIISLLNKSKEKI